MSTTWTGVKGGSAAAGDRPAGPAMLGGGIRPFPSAIHACDELAREDGRKESRELFATDAAWALAYPGPPSDEARAWCELGELAVHWDRILDEAGG